MEWYVNIIKMSWGVPQHTAIVHIDGDAFFASCEQAVHPEYRGKPVITGAERGIVAAASYEAKKYGIKRGVPLWEVKKLCPQAIIVPSDYETYSLFSKRLFECMRRFTPTVEEYGIDEGFGDITGLRGALHRSYPEIAQAMQTVIEQELGISVSVGLATSKVLAKLGSKWNKPHGCTVISNRERATFLAKTTTEKIWGIGHATAAYLQRYGIHTAAAFTQQSEQWVKQYCHKPIQELWQELCGQSVWPVNPATKKSYQSISKTKTFTPPSSDPKYVFAQLSKNIENACIKARRYQLGTQAVALFLKTQNFRYHHITLKLSRRTAFPNDILPLVQQQFHQLFRPHTPYRATGVVLLQLETVQAVQMNLFEGPVRLEKLERVYASIDSLAKRYGKHTVRQASSLATDQRYDQRRTERLKAGQRYTQRHAIHQRKFVSLPTLAMVI